MKLISAFSLLCFCSLVFSYDLEEFEIDLEKEWQSFKTTYGSNFLSDEDEIIRKNIFEENLWTISMHNMRYSKGFETFELGVNQFSDMTFEEFQTTMLTLIVPKNLQGHFNTFHSTLSPSALPKEVDWRKKNLVTPVKNQGKCGSCWAFSSTGSIEGQHAKKTGKLVALSEQNLVDCSGPFDNHGCNGGWMERAFNYVIFAGGINTEKSYPYVAKEQQCRFNKTSIGANITGYVVFVEEQKLTEVVATVGPISVAVDASHKSFKSYKKGIYFEPACNSTNLGHGVLVVGYGTESGQDFWIIKNSWGTSWGEDGYMRMARNKNNHCGIASNALYPLV